MRVRLPLAMTLASVTLLAGCATTNPTASPTVGGSSPATVTSSATATPAAAPSSVAPGAMNTPSTGGVTYTATGKGRLDGKTIVVDPGHNAHYITKVNNVRKPMYGTIGARCQSAGGGGLDHKTDEHTINWQIANRVVPKLLQEGATVILTRPNDDGTGPCNDERADMANRSHADFMLSIHADGADNPKSRGFYFLLPGHSPGGQQLIDADNAAAQTLLKDLSAQQGMVPSNYVKGQIKQEDVAMINNLTSTRGVLIEMGNLASPEDFALMTSPEGQDAFAAGLTAGVTDIVAPA